MVGEFIVGFWWDVWVGVEKGEGCFLVFFLVEEGDVRSYVDEWLGVVFFFGVLFFECYFYEMGCDYVLFFFLDGYVDEVFVDVDDVFCCGDVGVYFGVVFRGCVEVVDCFVMFG